MMLGEYFVEFLTFVSFLQSLLERENLHSSLMACCLEIIIFSYNSQR